MNWNEADDIELLRETIARGEEFTRPNTAQVLPQQFGKTLELSPDEDKSALQARFNEAQALAVVISPPPPTVVKVGSPRTQSTSQLSTAEITWGIGGAAHRCEVDITVGQSFVLCASYVQVKLTGNYVQPAGVPPLRVATSIVPCAGANATIPPLRTVHVGTLGIGVESAVFPIPAFAREVRVGALLGGGSLWALKLFTNQGQTEFNRWTFNASGGGASQDINFWVPINSNISGFSLINNNPTSIINTFAMFRLGII